MSRTKLILLIVVLVGGAITAWLWSRGDLNEPPEDVYRRMIASAEIAYVMV